MATLSDLPPEVLVHCLAYTGEVKTVVSSRAWDSHFRALFAANAEPLFAALARMKGWTQYQSAGDASQTLPDIQVQSELATGLQQAVEAQNSGLGSFDHVASWEAFIRLRVQCEANWRLGRYAMTTIYYGRPVWRLKVNAVFLNAIAPQIEAAIAERGVHDWRATVPARQQVDTPKRLLLTSSAFGPLRSCNLDNLESGSVNRLFPLWYHTCPEFCHIELTNGHLVYIDARDAFQVLRVKPDDTGLEETRRIEVPTGRWLRYLKARWPYLVSGNTSYIAIWDLSSGRLVQEIELLTPQQVAYVDFNPDWIFLCCRSGLKLVSRTTGRVEHDLPPPIARPKNHEGEGGPEATGPSVEQELSATGGPLFQDEDDTSDSEVESVDDPSLADLLPTQLFLQSDWPPSDPLPTVTAAHHDPSTSVLVALFERNMFMISSLEPLGGTATVFAWMPGHTFTQIAVENGRAAVVAESDSQPGQTLFLLHFNAFDSCEAFMARPASLTVVDPVMPAFASISRIEMDSTAIYVTGSSMSPGQARQRNAMNDYCASDKHYQKIGWSWYTPDGQRIPLPVEGVAGREEDHGLGGLTTRDPNQEVTERPASDTLRLDLDAFSDSVVVYRFDQTRG